ncbi:MAG: alpha/beta fold hydrolase [Microbacterium sp.]|uniref:alpha/beta fold hydrolase n=1 Tax=Microbacterium sp. TaxID=51671 RepID=UPI003A8A1621
MTQEEQDVTELSIFEPEGRAVRYIAEGGDGPTLALVVDRGLDGDALGTVAHFLVEEEGFRVLRVGLRGGADAVKRRDLAQDVVDVLDHVGLGRAWVGGHGFGGTVARLVAAEHQDRIGGLLVLGVEEEQIPLPDALPVLLIQGADDVETPVTNGERVRDAAPERVSVATIAGAGHLFPATHPGETAVIIEAYLGWD